MFKIISRIIFWSSVLFLAIFLWTVSGGQIINYEFRNHEFAADYYNFILLGAPVAILLTLFGTLKKNQVKAKKLLYVGSTIAVAMLSFMFLINNLFTIGFGVWTSFNIAYEHRANSDRQIREQHYDLGALGYGGRRVVELKPFANFFWKVSSIDTTKLDEAEWMRVDKEADIKFP